MSIVPALTLDASNDDISAFPIAPSAITPDPAVIVPDANSCAVIEPPWIFSPVMFPAKSVSISATSDFNKFISASVAVSFPDTFAIFEFNIPISPSTAVSFPDTSISTAFNFSISA